MSVDIEPFELNFRRPFTSEVAKTLTLKNPNTVPVAFKVKTTAPKQYCVRPNAGRIEAGQDFEVTVLLQAFKQDPAPDVRCRDKFLVQSAPITADKEFASIATVLEGTEKGQLQERKIRVNWLPEDPQLDQGPSRPMAAVTPHKPILSNGAEDTPDASRVYSSPGVSDEPAPSSQSPPPYVAEESTAEAEKVEEKTPVQNAIATVSTVATNTAQATYEELKSALAAAEAQIASFKESGLRQRNVKTAGSDDDKRPVLAETAQAVRQTVEGVPVQMVAILCFISFLLAYFFF